jgi:NitT/TauT family transport system substrate-binding protein
MIIEARGGFQMRSFGKFNAAMLAAIAGFALVAGAATASAQDTVRIALPTKSYYPTIVTEAAKRQKLFEKEGIKVEATVYRSGAEAFEAVAAGAADVTVGSTAIVAGGIRKGVKTKAFAAISLGYNGWFLMVKSDSKIKNVSELEGKKVGITSAGSASDILARWTMAEKKVHFTTAPLGGGGLVPNLLTGNVDAIVIYSPLSFKVLQAKTGRSLIDYGVESPKHLSGVWIASEKMIKEKPAVMQKLTNALVHATDFLHNNREAAIKIIADIDEIPPKVAAAEFDGNIKKLSLTGEMTKEWAQRGLDLAKLVGMTNLAPVSEIYTTKFTPVSSKH